MQLPDICTTIEEKIAGILRDRGLECPELSSDTRLLGAELPIDSLDLAVLVVELEELTGRDPFRDGFIEFRTIGELGRLYVE